MASVVKNNQGQKPLIFVIIICLPLVTQILQWFLSSKGENFWELSLQAKPIGSLF